MNKRDWLVAACKAEAWRRLSWRLSIFTVSYMPDDHEWKEYDIRYDEDGSAFSLVDGQWHRLDGVKKEEGVFDADEAITLQPGDYHRLVKTIKTSAGRYIYNWMIYFFAFGEKFEYENEGIDPNSFSKKLFNICLEFDDSDPGDMLPHEYIHPYNVALYVQAIGETAPMAMGIVPTGSLRTLEPHPDMYKIRDALFEKHKDELDDPNVIVKIQKQLDELETEWLSQDQSGDFFNSKKAMMRRRKLLIMHGIENAFRDDGKYDLIKTSLMEGGDLTKIVAKFNSVRSGSYDRGAETAKGGEQVRIIQMIYQNHKIVPGDCKTKNYHRASINEFNWSRYVGMNERLPDGSVRMLTEEYLKSKQGKTVDIRRPFLCGLNHVDCCAACASVEKGKQPRAVAADCAAGASNVMGAAMASMHGTDTQVTEFIPKLHIT